MYLSYKIIEFIIEQNLTNDYYKQRADHNDSGAYEHWFARIPGRR